MRTRKAAARKLYVPYGVCRTMPDNNVEGIIVRVDPAGQFAYVKERHRDRQYLFVVAKFPVAVKLGTQVQFTLDELGRVDSLVLGWREQ